MSLEITEMFEGIKNGTIELQTFHDWLCEPYTKLSDEEIQKVIFEHFSLFADSDFYQPIIMEFARAIEDKHGIR